HRRRQHQKEERSKYAALVVVAEEPGSRREAGGEQERVEACAPPAWIGDDPAQCVERCREQRSDERVGHRRELPSLEELRKRLESRAAVAGDPVREDEEEEDEADIDERPVPGERSRCGGARDATAFDLDLQEATFSTKAVS